MIGRIKLTSFFVLSFFLISMVFNSYIYAAITVPTATTSAATSVGETSATLNGTVTANGGGTITEYGFRYCVYGTGSYTTVKTTGSINTNTPFSKTITGLSPGTKYSYYAYAKNSAGESTATSSQTFTTQNRVVAPTVTTSAATSVGETSAILNGTVTANGGGTITEYGFRYCVYGTGNYTTVKTTGSINTNTPFSKTITGLSPGTKYSYYAYAKNSAGESTATSSQTFTTQNRVVAPTVTTSAATSVGETSAILNGTVTANGGGTITEYGFRYCVYGTGNYTTVKTTGSINTNTPFSKTITGLSPGTKYSYYAYAKNSAGESTATSSQTFTTQNRVVAPTVTTSAATSVGETSAILNGTVTANGGGTITEYGFRYCVYGTGNYTTVKTTGSINTNTPFNKTITGLTPGTKYSYYAYAKNSAGESTATSSQTFTTQTAVVAPTVTTSAATSVGETSATLNGVVDKNGGGTITEYGFRYCVYGTGNYTTVKTTGSINTNTPFEKTITGLTPGTKYSYYAYAKNSAGESTVSSSQYFTTQDLASPPTVTTSAATSVGETSATLNGVVDKNGGATITEYGFRYCVYGTGNYTTVKTTGSINTNTPFNKTITGLSQGTKYSYYAYAVNSQEESTHNSSQYFTTVTVPESFVITAPTGTIGLGNNTITVQASGMTMAHIYVTVTDPKGTVYSVETQTGNSFSKSYNFTSPGTYTIHASGRTTVGIVKSAASVQVTVQNKGTLAITAPSSLYLGSHIIKANATGITLDHIYVTVRDENNQLVYDNSQSGNSIEASINFASSGNYTINATGCMTKDSSGYKIYADPVTVYAGGPVSVNITKPAEGDTVCAGEVTIKATGTNCHHIFVSSLNPSGKDVVGAAKPGNSFLGTYDFEIPGKYQIIATGCDKATASASGAKTNHITRNITVIPAPSINITAPTKTSFKLGETINFKAVLSNCHHFTVTMNGNTIVGYQAGGPSYTYNYSYKPTKIGTYKFSVSGRNTANDTDPGSKKVQDSITFSVGTPIADGWTFAVNPDKTVIGNATTFDASGTGSGVEIISYDWYFGDGTAQKGQKTAQTSHTYTSPGEYTVTLQLNLAGGSSFNYTRQIKVVSRELRFSPASFNFGSTGGSATLKGPEVQFGGKKFNLFNLPISTEITLDDCIKVTYDAEEDKYIVSQGLTEDSAEGYQAVKKIVNMCGKTTDRDFYNSFRALQKKLRSKKISLGIEYSSYTFGYMEFNNINGQYKCTDGGILVVASADASLSYPLPPAPVVYVKVGVEAEATGKLNLKVLESGQIDVSSILGLNAGLYGGLGAGKDKWVNAEGGIKGIIETELAIPVVSLEKSFKAQASLDLYFKYQALLFVNGEHTWKLKKCELWPPKDRAMLAAEGICIGPNDMVLMPRDYLNTVGTSTARTLQSLSPTSSDLTTIKSSVFPYGAPQLLSLGGNRQLLIWIDDDTTRSLANRTSLMYSIFDGSFWSTPQFVNDDGTADFCPRAIALGEQVYLTWQNANTTFADTVTLEEMAQATDLSYARFNGTSFTDVISLTDSVNTISEMLPTIAAQGDEVSISWVENTANDSFGVNGTNSIIKRTAIAGLWGERETLTSGVPMITGLDSCYHNGSYLLAYVTDMDGDVTTNIDTEVYLIKDVSLVRVTDDTVEDSGVQFVKQGTTAEVYWQAGSDIKYINPDAVGNIKTLAIAASTDKMRNMQVLKNDNGDQVLMWEQAEGFINELYGSYNDSATGVWGGPIQLTNIGNNIRQSSAYLDNDNKIRTAFGLAQVLEVNDTNNEPYGNTDLVVGSISKETNLSIIDGISYNHDLVQPDATINLNMMIKNNGALPVNQVAVYLLDTDQTVLSTQTIEISLASGESGEIEIPYTMPSSLTKSEITVQLSPIGATDIDTSDNSVAVTIGLADLTLQNAAVLGENTPNRIQIDVHNQGYDDASNIVVTMKQSSENSEILVTQDIASLSAGASQTVIFDLDSSWIDFTSEQDDKMFFIDLTSDSIEGSYGNNTITVIVSPPYVMDISLNQASLELASGDSARLEATVYPMEAVNQHILWVSGDEAIATVDETGLVSALKAGESKITAVTIDGNKMATCNVNVTTSTPQESTLTALPSNVSESDYFNQTFTLTLSLGSFIDDINSSHITIGGDFAGLTIDSVTRDSSNTVTVQISGVLIKNMGNGTITVSSEAVGGINSISADVLINASNAICAYKSTSRIDAPLNVNSTSTITLTLKDADGNLITNTSKDINIVVTITNEDSTTEEQYIVAGEICTSTATVPFTGTTDDNGQILFDVQLPPTIDTGDRILIQAQTNIGGNIGIGFVYPVADHCFIATAAFGSKIEPAVILLRQFRDRCLLTNSLGQVFVQFYYYHSPPIAAFIARSEPMKLLVRILLLPLIAIAYTILHPVSLGVLACLFIFGLLYRRKIRLE